MKPHDAVFRKVFSVPEVASDYLRAELPPNIWRLFRPETLRLVSGSFVSPSLAAYFSDVLYTAELHFPTDPSESANVKKRDRQSVTISFLFEHKASQPDCIHQQIGLYQFSLWNHQHDSGQPLTPIVPMVIYHGERQWREHSFPDCFPKVAPEFLPFIPPINFYLTNLHNLPQAEINQRYHALSLQVLFQLLQAAFKKNQLIERLDEILQGLARIAQTNHGDGMAKAMFTYLTQVANAQKMNSNQFISKINRLPQNVKAMFKSIYDEILEEGVEIGLKRGRQEGRQEGRMEGRQEGRQEGRMEEQIKTAEKCLRRGMSIADVADLLDMPPKEVGKIAKRLGI